MTTYIEDVKGLVDRLWEDGYAQFPIKDKEALVLSVKEKFKLFLNRHELIGDLASWSLRVPGEEEDDAGLIQKNGVNEDLKSFFHYSFYLPEVLLQQVSCSEEDKIFLEEVRKLYEYAADLGSEIAKALDEKHDLGILKAYKKSLYQPNPHAISMLRCLLYQDVPEQEGARAHVDKAAFAIHFGDEGGDLVALEHEGDTEGKVISPKPGYAVVFFGVKILWLTAGERVPLWHKSTTVPGMARTAFVFFAQLKLKDYTVVSSKVAYKLFYDKILPLTEMGEHHWD